MVRYVARPIPIAVRTRQTGDAQTGAPDCLVDETTYALEGTVRFDATVLLRSEGSEGGRRGDDSRCRAHVGRLAAGHVADLCGEDVCARLNRRTRLRRGIAHCRGDLIRRHTRQHSWGVTRTVLPPLPTEVNEGISRLTRCGAAVLLEQRVLGGGQALQRLVVAVDLLLGVEVDVAALVRRITERQRRDMRGTVVRGRRVRRAQPTERAEACQRDRQWPTGRPAVRAPLSTDVQDLR